jgi:pantetheine-phosphate adenylyltransferase
MSGIKAVYPGTFDPLTNGHIDVATRASRMFDKVVVAVARHPSSKTPYFTLEQRVELAREALHGLPNVEVQPFHGLLIECAREQNAQVIVRGLRAVSDFEYEVQLAGLNRQMEPNVETAFIAAGQKFAFLSSSMVREIARLGGDVSDFVHPSVKAALDKRMG